MAQRETTGQISAQTRVGLGSSF